MYRKCLEVQNAIDYYEKEGDGEGDALEAGRLRAKLDAILRNFKEFAERHARNAHRSASGRQVVASFNSSSPQRPWADVVDSDNEEDHDEEGFFDGDQWNESMFWTVSESDGVYVETFQLYEVNGVPKDPESVEHDDGDEVQRPNPDGVARHRFILTASEKKKKKLKGKLISLTASDADVRTVHRVKAFEKAEDNKWHWNPLANHIFDRLGSSGMADQFFLRDDGNRVHQFFVRWEDPGSDDSELLVERRLYTGPFVPFPDIEAKVSDAQWCDFKRLPTAAFLARSRDASDRDAGSGGPCLPGREWSRRAQSSNESAAVHDHVLAKKLATRCLVPSSVNRRGACNNYRATVRMSMTAFTRCWSAELTEE